MEATGQKQAAWRTDPKRSGAGGCVGDIGTHAFNLAEFVTGLRWKAWPPTCRASCEGRPLDDNAGMLLRFGGGARGMLWATPGRGRQRERAAAARLRRPKAASTGTRRQPNSI